MDVKVCMLAFLVFLSRANLPSTENSHQICPKLDRYAGRMTQAGLGYSRDVLLHGMISTARK